MELWRSVRGMMEAELTCAEPEEMLRQITAAGIELYTVKQHDELTLSFQIQRSDYPKLSGLCKSKGGTLKLGNTFGIFWTAAALRQRPVLLLGGIALLALVLYLPSRVLFVEVTGNTSVPRRQILAAAEESGIRFGASRRAVRSEKVKNKLLSAVPELQWAGVNTTGCVATVSVRERTASEPEEKKPSVTSIVAARDGYILSGTVTRGTGQFQTGQTVTEGQILISGYTDCGISIQATQAEGEIFAMTERNVSAVSPLKWIFREEEREERKKISLLIGKKRINLWKGSGIYSTSCGRMYKEYYMTLPGDFRLPLALCVETITDWDTAQHDIRQEDAGAALEDFAQQYLTAHMTAGQILSKEQAVWEEEGIFCLQGRYTCTEMIGRVRQEQIGDTNGESG